MDIQQIEKKLKALVRISDTLVSNETFVAGFRLVLEVVEKIKALMLSAIQNFNSNANTFFQKVERDLAARLSYFEQKIDAKLATVKNGIDGRDGVDADEDRVAEKASNLALQEVAPKLLTIIQVEENLAKQGGFIATLLEALADGDKLKIDAIQGLRELLEEIRRIKSQRLGGGGGFSIIAWQQHVVDNETPVGTPNGILTDFTLATTPSPATSLKVFVNGQRMKLTEDYTLSGNTITFLTAPPTGSILLADYKQ